MYQWKLDGKMRHNSNWNSLTRWCSTVQPIKCLNLWVPNKWWDLRGSFPIRQNRRSNRICITKDSLQQLTHCKMIYMLVNFLLKKKFHLPVWWQINTGTANTMTMSPTCLLYQVIMNILINMVIGPGISRATTTSRTIASTRSTSTHRAYRRPAPLLKAQTRRRTRTTS